jgi:putative transposase
MPKANRFFVPGRHYHLTHRCHDRNFLFKFVKDRDMYRELLRDRSVAYKTPVLSYCITSNHVHLLVQAKSDTRISEFMDCLEGDFAQYYNHRKKRSGVFWGGRYHASAIEDSSHLWNCALYIELNMVRAGVVPHPADWAWCSYPELMGLRNRYRIIDQNHFADVFACDPSSQKFRDKLRECIEQKIAQRELSREPIWTESLAIGSEAFIEEVSQKITGRRKLDKESYPTPTAKAWVLREPPPEYS